MAYLSKEEITKRFGFHKATIEGENATANKHAVLREDWMDIAKQLDDDVPDGRYKSLMLTALEEASMWSHKAIAND